MIRLAPVPEEGMAARVHRLIVGATRDALQEPRAAL